MYYNYSNGWKGYDEYNKVRSELLDYGVPNYDIYKEKYDSIGFSRNDVELLKSWCFADFEKYNVRTLKDIASWKEGKKLSYETIKLWVKDFIARTGIRIDALFLGHSHVNAHTIFPYQYKSYDENGKLTGIIDHQIQIFVDPSFQGENEHFLSKNIDRSSTNAMATILSERKNPYYIEGDNKNLPYILEVKRFPLLKENLNEYTIPAQLYQEKMPDQTPRISKEISELIKEPEIKNRIDQATGLVNAIIKKGGKNNGR